MGRPSVYDPEIAAEILERLEHGESLISICNSDDRYPGESTVRNWAKDDRDGFAAKYAHARQAQALHWAEEIIDIADTGDKEDTQRARLRVDTRKWVVSKVLPKVYGDKVTVGGDSEAPIEVVVRRTIIRPEGDE
jgi:hypothetical protein